MGDGMQCADHPYRSNQGGICAYCLQERLGKLVSSKSNPFFPLPISPSPSSPPDLDGPPPLVTVSTVAGGTRSFLSKKKIKNSSSKKMNSMASSSSTTSSSSSVATGSYSSVLALKRSKSVAPRPLGGLPETINAVADSPRKKSFWSFLYHPAPGAANGGGGEVDAAKRRSTSTASGGAVADLKQQTVDNHVTDVAEESPGGSQASSSFGRKVSRSRSVGCGSRSFSGDFLERISTGFGDCTLRRVESHREGKQKCTAAGGGGGDLDDEQQRFKCGGLFGGFGMIITEASEEFENAGRRMSTSARLTAPHGRHRGWGWASLASPMRALKPTATGSTAPSTTIISTTAGSSSSNSTVNNSIDKLSCNTSMLEVGS